MTLLTVHQLSKQYKDKLAVDDVSFQFTAGKCVALIGPNGAGKTTILRTLAGLLKPTSGTVQFSNQEANTDIRTLIGYLPQYPVFYSWMTGLEFLVYSGELTSLSKSEATERALELLEKVGITEAKNRRIGKYSGGMKQRLRSEEHTSELQSRGHLVCRLLLEKKKATGGDAAGGEVDWWRMQQM